GSGTLAGTFAIFFSGLIVVGAGQGVVFQNRLAVADLYPPERRGQGLALFMSVSVVGVLASPLLLNLSAQYAIFWGLNLYAVPWFFSAGILGAGLVTTLLVKPDPRDISENLEKYYPDYRPPKVTQLKVENEKGANAPIKITTILGIFPILVALAVSASAQGIMTMLMGLTSVYLTLHAVHIELVSLALAIHTIGMFGLSIPFGKITDRYGRKKVLLISLGFSTIGSILTPATTDFLIITLGIFLIGLGWSAAIVASTSVIADVLSPRQRGKGIGINDLAIGATAVLFPMLGGIIFETSGFLTLGLVSLIAIVPALILVVLLKETRPGVYAHPTQTTP
ncbi:MAG: MFS transporter, partial [Candidatus Bathyarchaeia archaeon]